MGVSTIVKNIKLPNFTNWFIIPFILFTIISLVAGYYALKKAYANGGFTTYSEQCKIDARTNCANVINDNDRKKCEDDYLNNNCTDTSIVGSKGTVLLVHILGSLFVAFLLALMTYKIVLYILNPKLAFGVILFRSVF